MCDDTEPNSTNETDWFPVQNLVTPQTSRYKMKLHTPFFSCFLLVLFSLPLLADEEKPKGEGQKVVVHLSHFTDDLHRCFMALKVAELMQEYGAEVTIFLDLEGVRLAERRQTLDLTWGSNSAPLSEHYNNFIKAGGNIVLCPHCAKAARIGEMSLKRKAQIGTRPMLGKLLIQADKIMDY